MRFPTSTMQFCNHKIRDECERRGKKRAQNCCAVQEREQKRKVRYKSTASSSSSSSSSFSISFLFLFFSFVLVLFALELAFPSYRHCNPGSIDSTTITTRYTHYIQSADRATVITVYTRQFQFNSVNVRIIADIAAQLCDN